MTTKQYTLFAQVSSSTTGRSDYISSAVPGNAYYLLVDFQKLPQGVLQKDVVSTMIYITCERGFQWTTAGGWQTASGSVFLWGLTKPWTDKTPYSANVSGMVGSTVLSSYAGRQTFSMAIAPPYDISNGLAITAETGAPNRQFFIYAMYLAQCANPIYAVVTVRDRAATPQPISPIAGYIDRRVANTFTWTVPAGTVQSSAMIYWRRSGTADLFALQHVGSGGAMVMPANILQYSNIEWWVVITDNRGNQSDESDKAAITTVDVVPLAPIPKSPLSSYIRAGEQISFRWTHNSPIGSPQGKYDIQYSYDGGGVWSDLAVGVATAASEHTASPDGMSAGRISWRVRTYNTYDVASPWSDPAEFFLVGAPEPPTITSLTTSGARVTATWASTIQCAYEVLCLTASGDTAFRVEAYGADHTHTAAQLLPNGDYVYRVRVQNTYGYWSAWAELLFSIAAEVPEALHLHAAATRHGIVVSWDKPDASIVLVEVYRDDIPLARVNAEAMQWTDYTTQHRRMYRYHARAITFGDEFSTSATIPASASLPYATIAAADRPGDMLPIRYNIGERPARTMQHAITGTLTHYDGRAYPVSETGEHTSETLDIACVLTLDEYDQLRALVDRRQTMIYRDTFGRVLYGVVHLIGARQHQRRDMAAVSFTIARVDHKVGIT